MQRPNYASLRGEHQTALEALNGHVDAGSRSTAPSSENQREPGRGQEPQPNTVEQRFPGAAQEVAGRGQEAGGSIQEPVRPDGVRQSPGWTSMGGMEQQQASAIGWDKRANEMAEQRMAALNQHIEQGGKDQSPDKGPDRGDDLAPKPDGIER